MRKIIILDQGSGEVHVFNYDNNIWESPECFLSENFSNEGRPFKESECSWMLTNSEQELSITIH